MKLPAAQANVRAPVFDSVVSRPESVNDPAAQANLKLRKLVADPLRAKLALSAVSDRTVVLFRSAAIPDNVKLPASAVMRGCGIGAVAPPRATETAA